MTADEIHERIKYLRKQIDILEVENVRTKRSIEELEEGGSDASSMIGKWEKNISNCYSAIKCHLAKVNPKSGFISYYLEEINNIYSGKEVEEISQCLSKIKSDAESKLIELENNVRNNNNKIYKFQNEISELRAKLASGVE